MKKISLAVLAFLLSVLVWYFFIHPADFTATFQAKALPGTLNQTLKNWNFQEKGEITGQKGLGHISQQLQFNDSIHLYRWSFKAINDSTSKVKVQIKDLDHSWKNRYEKIFNDTDFERRSAATVKEFYDYVETRTKRFNITYDGESELPTTYCAYVAIRGKQNEKSLAMRQHFSLLSGVMANNGVKLNGTPFIEVTDWDIENDSISYNFCFPIVRSERLPLHPEIQYKRIFATKALKATYNGDYTYSDRAWYTLLYKANELGKDIEAKPIEVFHNNPSFGDEMNWIADIYMPLK